MKLVDLFLPSDCTLCRRPPQPLCESCLASLGIRRINVVRQIDGFGSLHGCSILEWNQDSAALLVAFKDLGVLDVGRVLAERLAEAAAPVKPAGGATTRTPQVLLAAPSSAAATRRRGYVPALELARVLGKHWGLPVARAALARATRDQAKLSQAERLANLSGAITLPTGLAGKRVWLVDDIVTTGATLGELARAATSAGASVVGFCTVAESSLKNVNTSREKGLT